MHACFRKPTLQDLTILLRSCEFTFFVRRIWKWEVGAITDTSRKSAAERSWLLKSMEPGWFLQRQFRSLGCHAATWQPVMAGPIWPTIFRWIGNSMKRPMEI